MDYGAFQALWCNFLQFYFSLQKIGENKVPDIRIKGLKGNHMNVI